MAIQHVNAIAQRLSLRAPQRESLEILARLCDIAAFKKDTDPAETLRVIQSEFPSVEDFEREFPSLCFALATGVGKTRLMGAFITYLHQVRGFANFFVLAPNLTIYNKLIADFTPNTPKYVFKGISDFARVPPLIVTGDNYEDGKGAKGDGLFHVGVTINIFNISKINSEVRGGNAPRIKRLSEYIGESYYDYLAGLPDLVMVMDESHRYRASAGVRAINELKPVLGLELTATPQVEAGKSTTPFKNIIFNYPLSAAMTDGFVKEPAVATRENFDKNAYTEAGLEKVKLEDGVRIHENTKVELDVYARNHDAERVKPFMLVVAADTTHANALQQAIEGPGFFEGRYKGKVIQVHSKQGAEEKDEVVQQLLTVEHPDNPIEIVIHVNMLKEGWDVTNLYTIVPLRAANSKTLVEQSIGRGLRLPYGKRVGVPAVDRLTIVSHDKFQEIVDHAGDPNSIIRAGVVIGRDLPADSRKTMEAPTALDQAIAGTLPPEPATRGKGVSVSSAVPPSIFTNDAERFAAQVTRAVISQYERRLPGGAAELERKDIQQEIVTQVTGMVCTATPADTLPGMTEPVNIAEVVRKTTQLFRALSIDIPKIVIVPAGEVVCRYEDFDLDTSAVHLQPVSEDILIRHLHEGGQYNLRDGSGIVIEKRPEDYLIRGLVDYDDVDYDIHADLLYKLAGQVVSRLRSYLTDEKDVVNVLQYHQRSLVELIYAQMQRHFSESANEGYVAQVTRGFQTLRSETYSAAAGEEVRDFRLAIPEGQRHRIPQMVFGGFGKCLFPIQKFDTDPERRFAAILENDADVEKWFKPVKGNFHIHYNQDDVYEPDFVVEACTCKYICEPKRALDMDDPIVLAKADAAALWCRHATMHAKECGGKPWKYLLIPHDRIIENATLSALAGRHAYARK